jgi:hypothetical protein
MGILHGQLRTVTAHLQFATTGRGLRPPRIISLKRAMIRSQFCPHHQDLILIIKFVYENLIHSYIFSSQNDRSAVVSGTIDTIRVQS